MTKKRRNLRILASIIAAGCVWATGMSNAWAEVAYTEDGIRFEYNPDNFDTGSHGNSYEAKVVLSASKNSDGSTGLGITLYRGDKKSDNDIHLSNNMQYMGSNDAIYALGDKYYNPGYTYTMVTSSATAEFNQILSQTVIANMKAMALAGESVWITGDGTTNDPYIINAADSAIKGIVHTGPSDYVDETEKGGVVSTTVTETRPKLDGNGHAVRNADGSIVYEDVEHTANFDISGYVGDVVKNEAGDATINYDGDIGTQNTSTIEQAINKNYTKIENVENNYVTNITDGDYSDRNNHTWNLTQNITVNGETTTQTVTIKDLNTTNKLLATDWLPNADHSGLSDDIRVTLMDTDNNEVHSTIFDVAKASLVGKLTDITGDEDMHSGVRARVGNEQGVTIATLVGEAYTEAHRKTSVQSGDGNLNVTAMAPMSNDENTAVIYNIETNPDSTYRSITINPNIQSWSRANVHPAGIDMSNTKIVNVQDGRIAPDSKDAINGSQLWETNRNMDKLGGRLDKVGAGAAALAALHPMDFDPDDKLQFSAGVGNYKGETAAALGAFYRPTEKVMFSVAGTMGNGENMVNAGVTFALDRKNNVSNSRVAMAHEIKDLREQVAALTALVSQIAGKGNPLLDTVMFPDVPENHWAYDYVENLQKRGIIEGYPDGNFGGDRSMTRYEYAAMLYRALEKGFPVDGRLLKEFEAELGRIRIDRIKGADDDANKVERVRVNDYEDRDDYGSKLAQVVADAAPVVEEEPAA